MCGAQAAGAVVLAELPGPVPARRVAVAAGILAAAALAGVLLARRRRDPLAAPAHLDELWARVVVLAGRAPVEGGGPPATATTSAGVRLAATWAEHGLHLSLSHPDRSVAGLPAALGLAALARTERAVHAVVPPVRLPLRAAQPGPHDPPRGYDYAGVTAPDDGSYFGP
jgi:hypothetical protein